MLSFSREDWKKSVGSLPWSAIDEFRLFRAEMANESLSQNDQVSDSFSWAEIYINVMLNIVLIFLILFGNVMIVCSYKANHALRTGSNTIILSLAISDIVVGVVSIPAWCYISLSGWQSSGWAYSLFKFFDILSASSSTLHLTSITTDRYVAISRPFYHAGFSSGLYHKIVAALWCLATIMALSNILVMPSFSHYGLVLLLGLILGCLSVITILNAGIFRRTMYTDVYRLRIIVCVLFLIKLRWPKNKSLYDTL